MVRQRTCIYEQFGTCKHGTNCNFLHPTLVCDDQKNCDIALCHKRHPQLCLYDTIFNKCMNEDSETCRFHHRSRNDIDEEKYIELEEKYNKLLEEYQNMSARIQALEVNAINKVESIRTNGDIKRKIDCQEEDVVMDSSKKNKIDNVTLVSDDEAKILQMEVETEEEAIKNVIENSETDRKKVNEVSYGVFYKNFEKELENIKKFVDKQKRMDVDKIQNIKEMFTKIGKDYRFGKRTQNMRNRSNVFAKIWKQTVEKIVNSENLKFRKITSAEIQKLMKLCKNKQNIAN